MSILRPVIRHVAVAALRNNTWAGAQVYDSNMTPFADAMAGQAEHPYVTVYTDTDDRVLRPGDNTGTEFYTGIGRALSVVIEMGIASAVAAKDNSGAVIQFADTDPSLEMAVDVLEDQVIGSLFGDPTSTWGELFKRIIYRVSRMPSRRGGQAATGSRFAARRLIFVCDTINDIPPGVVPVPEHPINRYIALASDPANAALGLADAAKIVSGLIVNTAAPSWRQAQAWLGTTTEGIRNLQVDGTPVLWNDPITPGAPPTTADSNEYPPPLVDIKLARDDTNVTDSVADFVPNNSTTPPGGFVGDNPDAGFQVDPNPLLPLTARARRIRVAKIDWL